MTSMPDAWHAELAIAEALRAAIVEGRCLALLEFAEHMPMCERVRVVDEFARTTREAAAHALDALDALPPKTSIHA